MIIQLFRNRIYESRSLKYRIKKLESFIRNNLPQKEQYIVKGLTSLWRSLKPIRLKPFRFRGKIYPLRIEFYQAFTHGYPYIKVKNKVSTGYGQIEYETEYGDLAFIVDYLFKGKLVSSKISILQSKKEKSKDKVDIPLHQHYLMEFWPDVEFTPKSKPNLPLKFNFPNVSPDEFSFYHFILNYGANLFYSSSVCSAPFVGLALGTTRQSIEKPLVSWCNRKRTNPHLKPPSRTLSMSLLPGSIYQHGKYYKWNLLTKPFTRFILDAAYLYVGTDHSSIFDLAIKRVPNILVMRVTGGEEKSRRNENSRSDSFVFR